jgi:hypothetical protein
VAGRCSHREPLRHQEIDPIAGGAHDANNFVIGCPTTGGGVVLTDDPAGRSDYRGVSFPGDHASLRIEHNQAWLELVI